MRDRATLYLYQLQESPEGPTSVNPNWRIPAKGLEAALTAYLEGPTDEAFDLVRGWGYWWRVLPACITYDYLVPSASASASACAR